MLEPHLICLQMHSSPQLKILLQIMTQYQPAKQDGIQINCPLKSLIFKDLKEMNLKISVNKSRQMIFGKDVMEICRLYLILFQILQED
jgi:hypothetical protein